jgi:hypothetical protein
MLRALVAQRQELNRYVDQSDDDHSAAATGTSGEENEDQEAIVLPMVARTVDDEPKPE